MKKRGIILLGLLYGAGFCRCEIAIHEYEGGMTIDSLYGQYDIHEPVLIALTKSPMMQRLKKIRQYGVAHYVEKFPEYTRFEHSVGVMLLARRFGASLGEQVAAELHDVSHTVFSHVADYLYKDGDGKTSYQDDMHESFIVKTGIDSLLATYGYDGICSNQCKHTFTILEQDLPDLCADRIEYNCSGGYIEGLLTRDQIATIITDLHYEEGQWYFTTESSAFLLGSVSLHLTEHTFGTLRNFFTYRQAANALKRALEIGILTADDICFSHDDDVWNRLCISDDNVIQSAVDCVLHCGDHCVMGTPDSYDIKVVGKFRGLNPWVKTDQGFKRLAEVNALYREEYERVRQFIAAGCYIKYVA